MTAKVMVRGDQPNSYSKKNGERVTERLLTLLDISSDHQVPDTFEFLDGEIATNAPSLIGRQGTIHVREFAARQSGVRLLGSLVLDEGKKGS
jgi:hypothetical protein